MAEGKNSFILYLDQRGIFDKLSDEQAGKLIKHIFAYVNDEHPDGDFITELAFEGIKTTLKRDLKKWEAYIEKQRLNGKSGGRPRKPKKPKPFSENPSEPKKADSDSDSDSDSVSELSKDNTPQPPKGLEIVFPFNTEAFKSQWHMWKAYKKKQHNFNYKSEITEQAALTQLGKMSQGREKKAIEILHYTMSNGWKGFVEPKEEVRKKIHISEL